MQVIPQNKPLPDPQRPLPRAPVLGWSSFGLAKATSVRSIEDLSHTAITSSGRAALYQALLQLRLPPGSIVLVPTYHCPTMIAPVLLANLDTAFYGLTSDGLPNLDAIDVATANKAKAMVVAHYFGLAHSLARIRQWCNEHQVALIEDCAHCYFGFAGERPVGSWGDYSTASLSKFFPVAEGGVLASSHKPIQALCLTPPSFKAQLKGWLDVFEFATRHRRFAGINGALAIAFRLINSRPRFGSKMEESAKSVAADMMKSCDMGRINQAPTSAALVLKTILPRGRIIVRRRRNFAIYNRLLENISGAKPLYTQLPENAVPYVFPLWVDDADRVYHALRAQQLPIFRWDRIWPGTPRLVGDAGSLWSHHVLQLLCHQDLSETDVTSTALAIRQLLTNCQQSSV